MDTDAAQEILERLNTLREEFTFAADIFRTGGSEQGRASVQITLGVIQTFLMSVFGVGDAKPLIPLRQLCYALHDLDRGKVVPLLAPLKLRPASWYCIPRRQKSSTARMRTGVETFPTSRLTFSVLHSERERRC